MTGEIKKKKLASKPFRANFASMCRSNRKYF